MRRGDIRTQAPYERSVIESQGAEWNRTRSHAWTGYDVTRRALVTWRVGGVSLTGQRLVAVLWHAVFEEASSSSSSGRPGLWCTLPLSPLPSPLQVTTAHLNLVRQRPFCQSF